MTLFERIPNLMTVNKSRPTHCYIYSQQKGFCNPECRFHDSFLETPNLPAIYPAIRIVCCGCYELSAVLLFVPRVKVIILSLFLAPVQTQSGKTHVSARLFQCDNFSVLYLDFLQSVTSGCTCGERWLQRGKMEKEKFISCGR